MKIERLDVDTFRIPLPEPIEAAAAGVMTGFDMVLVRITDSDGASGSGYTVCHLGQGPAIATIVDQTFRGHF